MKHVGIAFGPKSNRHTQRDLQTDASTLQADNPTRRRLQLHIPHSRHYVFSSATCALGQKITDKNSMQKLEIRGSLAGQHLGRHQPTYLETYSVYTKPQPVHPWKLWSRCDTGSQRAMEAVLAEVLEDEQVTPVLDVLDPSVFTWRSSLSSQSRPRPMPASPRSSTGLVERVHVDAASGPFSASQLVQHSKRRQKRPAKALRRMHARQALEQQCQVTRRSGHGLPVGSGVDGGDAPLLDGHCDGPRRTFFEPSGHPPWPRADPADRLIMQNLNLMKWDSPPSCFTRRVHRKG